MDKLGIDFNNEKQIIDLLLKGHSELTFDENINIFTIVQMYITKTKRF